MKDQTTRFAASTLAGLVVFFFATPISCCGFVLLNEHRTGDVGSGGPAAIISAMGLGALFAVLGGVLAWRSMRER